MIIAWGLFILGLLYGFIVLLVLLDNRVSGLQSSWHMFNPILLILCSAQYIWG